MLRWMVATVLLLAGVAAGQTVQSPSGTNVSVLARKDGVQNQSYTYAASASGTDAYAITLAPAVTAYAAGQCFSFKADVANTGAATLNVSGLGAVAIKKAAGGVTTDPADNDIRAGQVVNVCHDGANFQMQSTLGNAASGGSVSVNGSAVSNPDFQATTAAPAGQQVSTKSANIRWQVSGSSVSAYTASATPRMLFRRACAVTFQPGTTTATGHLCNDTNLVTPTAVAASSTGNVAQSNFATAATAASSAGRYTAALSVYGVSNIYGGAAAYIVNNTAIRAWIGFSHTSAMNVDSTTTLHVAAFRFSTVVPDTNWQCVLSNGSAMTTADSGVAPSTTALQKFEVAEDLANSKYRFFINGNEVCSSIAQTNRPVSTTTGAIWVNNIYTQEAVAKNLRLGSYIYEADQ